MHNRNSWRRKTEKGVKNVFEEIAATCIKGKVPKKMNPNRPTPRHMVIKRAKVRVFQGQLETLNQIFTRELPLRLWADCSAETLEATRGQQDLFKILKQKNLQPRILWPSLVAQLAKDPPAMQETPVRSLGREDLLGKGWATHSSILGLPLWLSW